MQLIRQLRTSTGSAGRSGSSTPPLTVPQPQHSRCLPLTAGQQHAQVLSRAPQSVCRAISSDPEANQEFDLQMSPASAVELLQDKEWISSIISTWLDEEWTPLDVHQQLGEAAGAAYVTCRQQGDDDMSSLVLGLSNELLAFNYRETFVNAFEVANKVVEVLMMRSGINVCCTSDEDVQRLQRFRSTDSSDSS